MRKLKKFLCFMLCAALLAGFAAISAGAVYSDADQIVHTPAVDKLTELNVLSGKEDGSYFDPEGVLTRAEFCKILVLILNGGKDPELSSTEAYPLSDLQGHWAAEYITYCWHLGLVAGVGDGTFDPDGPVTGSQAAKMLLCTIGFNADTECFEGAQWAIAANVRANQKNFYEDLEDIEPREPLTRDNAAQMIYNAVNAVMVTYEYKLSKNAEGELDAIPVLKEAEDGRTLLSWHFRTDTQAGED